MKAKKVYGLLLVILIYVFPFRYAVVSPTSSYVINLLCFLATILGGLLFMVLTFTDEKENNK